MAIQVTKPLKHFVDISLAFSPHPMTGDITVLRGYRAINASLKNCIMIATEEKPFNMDFGSQILELMFEMCDEPTAALLRDEIERTIGYNEPRVKTEEIFVKAEPDINQFVCTVKYKIIGYDQIFTTTQILTPTR